MEAPYGASRVRAGSRQAVQQAKWSIAISRKPEVGVRLNFRHMGRPRLAVQHGNCFLARSFYRAVAEAWGYVFPNLAARPFAIRQRRFGRFGNRTRHRMHLHTASYFADAFGLF